MRRGRALTWVWLVLVAALLVAPAGTATAGPPGLPGSLADSISSCTPTPTDSCSVSDETLTSLKVSFAITPNYDLCTGGQSTGCVFSYNVNAVQTGYNDTAPTSTGVGSGSTSCDGRAPIVGNGVLASPPGGPFTCVTTFTWSATEYPIHWSVTLIEQDGGSNPVTGPSPNGHQATFSRPSPNPTASFTYAQTSTLGQFVFTSTSLQGSGPLEERWYSPDDHSQSPGPQRTWTHTFPGPGTYTINLEVSDAGPGSASATAEVVWDGSAAGSGTSIIIRTALSPASDKGRFKVTFDGATVFPAAGNGDNKTLGVQPGPHVIGEVGASGTNLFKYAVSMTCTVGASKLTVKGTVFVLQLSPGAQADCTITNKATKALHCVVPDLIGKKLSKATKALRKAHCAVGSLKPKHPGKKDKVTATSPTVGAVRAEGAKVKLTFG